MEEHKTYTDIEILNDAVISLGKLRIPVELSDELGSEVSRVWKNLNTLLKAMTDQNMRDNGCTVEEAPDNVQSEPEVISEETVGDEDEENT